MYAIIMFVISLLSLLFILFLQICIYIYIYIYILIIHINTYTSPRFGWSNTCSEVEKKPPVPRFPHPTSSLSSKEDVSCAGNAMERTVSSTSERVPLRERDWDDTHRWVRRDAPLMPFEYGKCWEITGFGVPCWDNSRWGLCVWFWNMYCI